MARTKTIIGNWKMNLDRESIKEFFLHLEEISFSHNIVAGMAPQAIHFQLVQDYAKKFALLTGVQDCSSHVSGAYTGELSAKSIKDMGADFTLVGHSERRTYHNESNELLKQKVKHAIENNLDCIYCVGETLQQRDSKQTFDVLSKQIQEGLAGLTSHEGVSIAYEPVWAIGTGKTATSEQAEEAHLHIRSEIEKLFPGKSGQVVILYGGSVKPSNVKELLDKANVDGALVGGASLQADSFAELCYC